jgi:polysaccharide pyruvyl transferase WcaK-like protein
MNSNLAGSVTVRPNLNVLDYVGWVGHGNMGDEALFEAIKRTFNPYKLIPSTNSLAQLPPQLHSGITLFGGGTLLPIWSATVMPNRFNYAYGVGVTDPDFHKYQYGEHAQRFYKFAIKKTREFSFRAAGVRGERSKELLREWGIESEIIGDPCLSLNPSSFENKQQNLVAVNIGSEPLEPWWGRNKSITKEVTKLCLFLKKKGYSIVLVPFSNSDLPYIQKISDKAGLPILKKCPMQSLLDFISTCHVMIGQRLHSSVFSAAAFTPFISIEYHPKCMEFSESVGFEEFVLRADRVNLRNLADTFTKLTNNWDHLHNKLPGKVEMYRNRLLKFATRVIMDIESLPEVKWLPPDLWKQSRFQVVRAIETHMPTLANVWRADTLCRYL